MQNTETVALAKVVKENALSTARNELTAGSYEVDCLVAIQGTMKVGEDTKVDVTEGSVDYKAAFATSCGILAQLMADQKKKPELLEELIELSMRQGDVAENVAKNVVDFIKTTERSMKKVVGTKPKKGTVTTKLTYRIVENMVQAA